MENSRRKQYLEYIATHKGKGDTKIYDSPRCITFTIPGIPFWSFDHQSCAPGIMGILEDCWIYARYQHMPELPKQSLPLDPEMGSSGFLSFQTDMETVIARNLYSHSVPIWPLKARFCLGYHTGAFITSFLELRTPHLPNPVITHKLCAGYVDARTRKKVDALPPWFLNALDGKQVLRRGLKLDRLMPRPERAFKKKNITLFSDIDHNKHTNYKFYVDKCYDALQTAVTIKETTHHSMKVNDNSKSIGDIDQPENSCQNQHQLLPKWITSDIMKQGVKTLRAKYIKETTAGEEVDIYLWQEEGKPFWVFFTLEREMPRGKESTVLFELALEYYEPQPSL